MDREEEWKSLARYQSWPSVPNQKHEQLCAYQMQLSLHEIKKK